LASWQFLLLQKNTLLLLKQKILLLQKMLLKMLLLLQLRDLIGRTLRKDTFPLL
jgi:hypothetical protein